MQLCLLVEECIRKVKADRQRQFLEVFVGAPANETTVCGALCALDLIQKARQQMATNTVNLDTEIAPLHCQTHPPYCAPLPAAHESLKYQTGVGKEKHLVCLEKIPLRVCKA